MRLINIHTMGMEEFFDEETPPYAILSHRWGAQEISFEQYSKDYDSKGRDILKDQREGYRKIKGLCNVARKYRHWFPDVPTGLRYVWIDTCCIDKRSSSELSEAVNSMYRWYRDAAFCCAYLSDVGVHKVAKSSHSDPVHNYIENAFYIWNAYPREPRSFSVQVQESEWFTRGWTLQELVGSSVILFFDAYWRYIAHKCELATDHVFIDHFHAESHSHHFQQDVHCGADGIHPTPHINELIATWCGIDVDVLSSPAKVFQQSLASRMSWASSRKTTRVEDMAYCMLGIFDINMPLLYGEGRKAFKRLQEEIIKISTDETIFAWFSGPGRCLLPAHGDLGPNERDTNIWWPLKRSCSCSESAHDGILAPEVSCFQFCSGLSPLLDRPHRPSEYVNGQRGLRLHASARKLNAGGETEYWGIPLHCQDLNSKHTPKDTLVPERKTFEWFYYGRFLGSRSSIAGTELERKCRDASHGSRDGLIPAGMKLEQKCRDASHGSSDGLAQTRVERALFGTIPVLVLKTTDGQSYSRVGIVDVIFWRYRIDEENLEDKVFFVKL